MPVDPSPEPPGRRPSVEDALKSFTNRAYRKLASAGIFGEEDDVRQLARIAVTRAYEASDRTHPQWPAYMVKKVIYVCQDMMRERWAVLPPFVRLVGETQSRLRREEAPAEPQDVAVEIGRPLAEVREALADIQAWRRNDFHGLEPSAHAADGAGEPEELDEWTHVVLSRLQVEAMDVSEQEQAGLLPWESDQEVGDRQAAFLFEYFTRYGGWTEAAFVAGWRRLTGRRSADLRDAVQRARERMRVNRRDWEA